MTTFSSQPDLVKLKPTLTPVLNSLNHRSFRCLGFVGPHAPFLLFFLRAPHVSHRLLLPHVNRCSRIEPPPHPSPVHPLRRHLHAVPPSPARRRRSRISAPPRTHAALCAAPTHPCSTCFATLRHRSPPPAASPLLAHIPRALLYSSALLAPQPGIYSILYTLCSSALKVFEKLLQRDFFDFVEFSSLILQGMMLDPLLMCGSTFFISFTHDHI